MAKILIIDDRPSNRELLTTVLGYKSHRLFVASDGQDGLAVARSERPDLIFSDVLMPTMDGFEFVRQLRLDSDVAAIPVVFTTAHYLSREAEKLADSCGVSAVLYKPFEPQDVFKVVDTVLADVLTPVVSPPPADEFGQEHLKLLTNKLAEKADDLRLTNAKLNALFEFSREIMAERDPESLTNACGRAARELIGARWAVAGFLDCETHTLAHVYAAGLNSEIHAKISDPKKWKAFDERLRTEGTLRLDKEGIAALESTFLPADLPSPKSLMAVGLAGPNACSGWLLVADKLGVDEFSDEDEQFSSTLATQVQIAYQNSTLWRRLDSERVRLENIIASVPGVVWEAWGQPDASTQRIDFVSDYVELMLGYTVEEWLRTPNFWLTIVHPDDKEKAAAYSAECYASGKPGSNEFRWLRKDGQAIWVSAYHVTVLNEDGKPVGMRGVCIDVTERKLAELMVRERDEQLLKSQKMEAIGLLAGGIAHDFNNLMTAVIGYAEMSMFRIAPNDPVRDNLSQIKSAGEKAGILTRQLLAFSRKQVLQPVVLNLNSVVKDIERMLGRIISEDIELITAVEDDLWNIDADPGQIEQVLMNLVLNSRDAMPDGGTIVVETSNVELDGNYARFHLDANPGQYAVLAISDTGVGMDEETRAHIFEPFYTTKPHTKGTGLGLSTVYGIVKQSGGFIWVYSELGLGTTFKIYLPRVAGEVAEISQMSAEPVVLRGSETILLVEDEEIVRNLAREILDSHGYNVLEARDGIEAMIRSREYRGEINILLTDIIMPDMGGPELHAILSNQRQQMRSIFMSGYTGDLITRQGLLDKKVPFIQKPFTPDGLLRKVRETLAG